MTVIYKARDGVMISIVVFEDGETAVHISGHQTPLILHPGQKLEITNDKGFVALSAIDAPKVL